MFSILASLARPGDGRPHQPCRPRRIAAALAVLFGIAPAGAAAQEQVLFPAIQNAQQVLLEKIRNETVRLDVAMWLLADGEVTQAIINKHHSGVPVRVLGDRVSIFEGDPNTRASFEQLANAGVPIRLRYVPTWFPEIMHWKAGIFVGQGLVEFGSANWTSFELKPANSTNFKDETVFFTDDPAIFRAFLTQFDRFWVDSQYFRDWSEVWRAETGQTWPRPMTISRTRLEPDYPTNPPGLYWSQGSELNNLMVAEINRETQRIDFVSYRLTVPNITDALIARHRAGVPVRVFIEPLQYRNPAFPEYWLVGATADRLWAAGVPIKVRTHLGLTHMKGLMTSNTALLASANFTKHWQRDHNYFISPSAKPSLYWAMRDRFDAMWADSGNYTAFQPKGPWAPALRSPASGASGVSTGTRLVWERAPFATAFDVYVGPSAGALSFAGRVNAVVTEDPPETYSFAPAQPLQPFTQYYWRVVSRTRATDRRPDLVAGSAIRTFTTGAAGTASGSSSGCVQPAPGPGWTCVNGAWVPPASEPAPPPPPPAPSPSPSPAPSPPPAPSTCTTIQPVSNWVCLNGGWVPPDSPLLHGSSPPPTSAPSPAPPQSAACTTLKPASNWVCVNGGWVPPDSPLIASGSAGCASPSPGSGWSCVGGAWVPPAQPPASCAGLPDPFVALGGGVCVGGGWVPRGHPLAGGR